jgi:hypothetical protein
MARLSLAAVDPALLNLEQWPTVDADSINPSSKRQHFEERSNAIDLLLAAEGSDIAKNGMARVVPLSWAFSWVVLELVSAVQMHTVMVSKRGKGRLAISWGNRLPVPVAAR